MYRIDNQRTTGRLLCPREPAKHRLKGEDILITAVNIVSSKPVHTLVGVDSKPKPLQKPQKHYKDSPMPSAGSTAI